MNVTNTPFRAIRAVNELRHLQAARDEFGDREVISRLTDIYLRTENATVLEATDSAVRTLKVADGLTNNTFRFKEMRRDMDPFTPPSRLGHLTGWDSLADTANVGLA